MKEIKVLRIIARLNIGGPAIHAILLTEGLDKDKFHSILVTGSINRGEEDMLYLARDKEVNPLVIPEIGREISWKNDLIAFWKLYKLIKKEKPFIVHTHTAKAGVLGRIAALLGGVPIRIHTFHGHIFHSYFSKARSKIFILFERFLALFTTKIIAVSQQVKEELLRYRISSSSKIDIIHLGLDLDDLLRLNPVSDNGYLKIGIVGRLTIVKNHKMFLDATKEILQKLKHEIRFVVIGDGELRQELENQAKIAGLLDNIIFTGWVKNQVDIYKDLDIVCLTSFNEGTPVSLIEAMAAGKPVVATKVGGVVDIVLEESSTLLKKYDKIDLSDRGILVDSFDPKIFAEALLLLINDSDLRIKLGEKGREFVRDRFRKERLIRDMEHLYQQLVTEKGR